MYPKGPQKGTNRDKASLSRKGPQVSRRLGTVWDFPEGLVGFSRRARGAAPEQAPEEFGVEGYCMDKWARAKAE